MLVKLSEEGFADLCADCPGHLQKLDSDGFLESEVIGSVDDSESAFANSSADAEGAVEDVSDEVEGGVGSHGL